MFIWALLEGLGVVWSRAEREQRLFPLCTHVQAELARRYGEAYRVPEASVVPEAYVEEAREILREILRPSLSPRRGDGGGHHVGKGGCREMNPYPCCNTVPSRQGIIPERH